MIGNKLDYQERIKEIENKEIIDKKINELSIENENLRNERIFIESAIHRLDSIESSIESFLVFNNLLISFNKDYPKKLGLLKFPYINNQEILQINKLIDQNKLLLENKFEDINNKILHIDNEFKTFEDINKIVSELKNKLIITEENINRLNININIHKLKEIEISKLENKRLDTYSDILNDLNNQKKKISSTINKFEAEKNELLFNIEFKVEFDIDEYEYINNVNELVDNRILDTNSLTSFLKNNMIDPILKILSDKEYNRNLSNNYKNLIDLLKEKLKKKTTYSLLHNTLLNIPINIIVNIYFEKIPLETLSMGQRAIVLLQIILAYDDKPLLIDQPEEALDNKYIYEQLVTAFRRAKKKRQIIIATHNANLVVNTDSEQIIVAEYNKGEISYSIGTIEDQITQDQIKSILEGGKEAFEKREEKYGYIF